MMPGWLTASLKSWEKFAFSMIRFPLVSLFVVGAEAPG
jgi:hypothetical protein